MTEGERRGRRGIAAGIPSEKEAIRFFKLSQEG